MMGKLFSFVLPFAVSIALTCSVAVADTSSEREGAGSQQPAVTPEQIEADWLHQDELRLGDPGTISHGGASVKPEEDAAGGVDGVTTGKWGFHTALEDDPWWQVDLQKSTPLERIVLYNRCDSCTERNNRILVLASDDGKNFKQLYQHNGTVFYGHSDKKPLSVDLAGASTRYVRLALKGHSYFHLDEVQLYAPDSDKNIALGKPATQSSTSQWSAKHTKVVIADTPKDFATAQVIERGLKLAEELRRLGAEVDEQAETLQQVAARLKQLPKDAPDKVKRETYMQARWTVREMTQKNPLLDFDTILFVKRVPPAFPHMSDQYYGWWSRPGGGICVLKGFKGDNPTFQCITKDWDEGSFLRPDISHDGRKVLFTYCKHYPDLHGLGDKVNKDNVPEDAFHQIYEMNLDGSGVRRLTHGKYDDFDARYLPDGDIVFLSTRKGQSLQVCQSSVAASAKTPDLPDSYVRCGGGNSRPVPVFTLQRMDGDGKNLQPMSAFENFEWTPSVSHDGRVLYARWDYIDRHNGPFMSLWSTNPDGTNSQLVYGNFTTRPQCVFEARSIPGSHKLVFTAAAHHSNMGGSLALLDRNFGTEEERPLTRLTPEVCFPETEGWPRHYYANPYPLSEQFFLVTWSDRGLPAHTFLPGADRNPVNSMGIYLYDAFGNQELLHRAPDISSMYPLPIRPRRHPATRPYLADWSGEQEGRFLLQDVYMGMEGIERGTIKRLRIIAVPPKVQPHMNNPVLGVSREDPGKFVLGTVPVDADGSAYFRVPSGIPMFFQTLDDQGMALQTMRSLSYVQPNETLACIGCHEHRDLAPPITGSPLAALREPSKLTLGPEGSWPLRFDQLVQPALDRHCVSCHRPDSDDAKAARFDLTSANSYQNLLEYGDKDLHKLAFEKPRSIAGDCPARKSKVLAILKDGTAHKDVRLDDDSFDRFVTWMDTYAHRLGHFSDGQEEQLRVLRQELAFMLEDK